MTDEITERMVEQWKELFCSMGLALHLWAQIEENLFHLFSRLLRSPSPDIDSVVFYSCPSFESKRTLTDRLAQIVLENDDDKETWSSLRTRLDSGGSFRGTIAHFSVSFDIYNFNEIALNIINERTKATPQTGAPYLRRSTKNKIPLSKKSKHKTLSTRTEIRHIKDHCVQFESLRDDVSAFATRLETKLPHPQVTILNTLQDLFRSPTKT
jgi:hypothetical protein